MTGQGTSRSAAQATAADAAGALASRDLAGNRRALARLLSVLEAGGPAAATALREVYPRAGSAHVVGLTGPPGSGKSTLAAALARYYRARDTRVAILAVDPTSPYSGGALLGDRVRMPDLTNDEGVFIRSVASRGTVGGLASAAAAMVAALDAVGYCRILVETVGVGQDEVAVAQLADTTVVVSVPGLGDEVQALKAGLLEVADVLVVNKADRPGAEQAVAELGLMQSLAPAAAWEPPILATVAVTGDGTAELADAIEAHGAYLASSGVGAQRREERARTEVLAAAQARVAARLNVAAARPVWQAAYRAVAAHTLSPLDVADDLVAALESTRET
ncbi:MAG TPA: methylmalonyl Co-A mutase-associated GTPase MeaB [Chloroflexota bacterium]|jgi:LAO/AO transport system kinase